MIMRTLHLSSPPSSSSLPFDSFDVSRWNPQPSRICCCSSRNHSFIPKLEPFNTSRIERGVKEPSIIEKTEHQLADYCSTLQGDDSYKCWRAYFELKDLERENPKEDIEKLILQSGGGVKTVMGWVHGISDIYKMKNQKIESLKLANEEKQSKKLHCPIPDGLPRSNEEIEEEEKGRMPDSQFTRLLRNKGRFPAWYTPLPDHETD
ncbi:hypothetical protein GIB67_029566 [Kingdonia uniflora]|uniref:CCG-binding protein 1 n=1 Tax=Kingdonia uniflora TaxID=39325 RepID=A0A7J7LL77_9MAGN|nr:hypothetical protein GIB67_029566 [Kingdonia uniflora]